jgi:hypothetical protein
MQKMLNVYSKIKPELPIFSLIRKQEITNDRQSLTPAHEFLQVAAKRTFLGDFFKPHKHLPCNKVVFSTQESWVIVSGRAKGVFYDIDDKHLTSVILKDGDCAVIYNGGHSLEILEDDTLLYEFKNGPYEGPEKDKEYIGE